MEFKFNSHYKLQSTRELLLADLGLEMMIISAAEVENDTNLEKKL
jgi:hypothetical protein